MAATCTQRGSLMLRFDVPDFFFPRSKRSCKVCPIRIAKTQSRTLPRLFNLRRRPWCLGVFLQRNPPPSCTSWTSRSPSNHDAIPSPGPVAHPVSPHQIYCDKRNAATRLARHFKRTGIHCEDSAGRPSMLLNCLVIAFSAEHLDFCLCRGPAHELPAPVIKSEMENMAFHQTRGCRRMPPRNVVPGPKHEATAGSASLCAIFAHRMNR